MFDNRYLYSTSRTKVLENQLLDKNSIDRMLTSKTAEEAFKVLAETRYSELMSDIKDYRDFEQLIFLEQRRVKAYIEANAPDLTLIGLLYLKYDVHNLKVLLKDKFLNASNQHLFVDLGTRPVSELSEMVESGNYDALNPEIAMRLREINSRIEQDKNPLWIDLLLDKGLYDAMITLSEKNKSGYIRELVKTQIDLINIKTLIRIKASSYDKEVLKDFIIDNGHLNLAFYEEAYDEALSALPGKLTIYGYEAFLEEAIEDFGNITNLIKYEQLAEAFFFEKVKQAKYVAFGVEPLIGYILAVENEAKLIRMIMVGKINTISTDAIKERLGDVYV